MASVFMTLPAFGGVGAYLDGKLLATHGSKVHTEIAYTLLRIGSARLSSAWTRTMTSAGVPAGATEPCHCAVL